MKPAQIKFGQYGVSLYGDIVHLSAEQIIIRLQEEPARKDIFHPGIPATLMMVVKGYVHQVDVQVAAETNGELTLRLRGPICQVQRRNRMRIPFQVSATIRAVRLDGYLGAWQNAQTMDISQGGMRLLLEPCVDIPQSLEVLFTLPDVAVFLSGRKRSRTEDGSVSVGLKFTRLLPSDQILLINFLNQVEASMARPDAA